MSDSDPSDRPIRVKLLSRFSQEQWVHQLPHGRTRWGRCEFLLDREARGYDWAVVYDDVPPAAGEAGRHGSEVLDCLPTNTLLVTTEPSSIKTYGDSYTGQFGVVLTSQETWALPHPQRIWSQPALHWFYGVGEGRVRSFDDMVEHPPTDKSASLSMVFSPKRMRHTLHWQRHEFMRSLMEHLPDMAVFGKGARPLDDKADALDAFRYHVAVENHIGAHHWTEKLSDAFLGMALPFYSGCPNVTDYFPPDSVIPIDLNDPVGAASIIRQAVASNEYERRLPAIMEARRRVLYDYNLFAVLARAIEHRHEPGPLVGSPATLYSRHALRRRHPLVRVRDAYAKAKVRAIHRLRRCRGT